MSVTTDWRSELLPQLTGLPLVPCGAGDKFIAPMDPATGYPARDWQFMAYSPEEIAGMGSKVLCVGTRLGPDADGIVCFDIDGLTALHKLIKLGVDPDTSTWRVGGPPTDTATSCSSGCLGSSGNTSAASAR